jgi:predicted acylesterase/phospholipase RssA
VAPSSIAPVKIQVVFQGGGAKLCALMAVVGVLREFEDRGLITVGRSAGSSAGAIAAVMLASDKPVSSFISELKEIAPTYVSKIGATGLYGYWRMWRGKALYDRLVLADFFRDLFCSDSDQRVKDLRLGTEIYFTDLYSLDARIASTDESIPIALANSCRVPLAFSGFASDDSHVDGGLALNLPVDNLLKHESENGRVIGISFNSKFANKSFDSLIDYTKQLFSAAIQAGVNRSKLLLGPNNVFSIETDIETFDFDRALDVGLSDKFEIIKYQFRDWLTAWLRDAQPLIPPSPSGPSRFIYPILNAVPLHSSVVQELHARSVGDVFTHGELISGYDTAILENGNFTGKYRSKVFNKLWIKKKTNVLSFDFQAGRSDATFDDLKFAFMAIDNQGRPLPFVGHVQELTRPADKLRSFRLFLFFDSSLMPDAADQPYVIEIQYEIDDPFENLQTQRDSLTLTGAQGGADEMIVAVAFPKAKLPATFNVRDAASVALSDREAFNILMFENETMVPSAALELAELIDKFDLTASPEHYFIVGRRLKNAEQGDCFGLAWG